MAAAIKLPTRGRRNVGILLFIFLVIQSLQCCRAQYSSDESSRLLSSRPYDGLSFPSKPRNTLRHGLSKLNSSISFGINESAIAAIFRGVAYGMTTSSPQPPPSSSVATEAPTTSTTTSPTTSSTTTSTTTTTRASPTSPVSFQSPSHGLASDESNENYGDLSPPQSGRSPSGSWDGIAQGKPAISDLETEYRSSERVNVPTPANGQHYGDPYDLYNSILDENINTERSYKSGESVHYRESAENIYGRHKFDGKTEDKTEVEDVEVQQVVDYAWVIHVYLTGVLMGVVAAMSICCISRVHFCSPIFPRNFFVTMHVLVFLAAFLRCILLFNGSFGEANSKLPKVLTGLLINSVPPCLTAAFALVLLVYLKATCLYVLPMRYQSSFVLAVISVVHIVSSVIVDICAGLSESESIINALRAGVQAVTAGWGIILCLGFIFLIAHLWKNEEVRAIIPKKSLQAIYVAVALELILACFTIYGIVTPRATKNKENDNTWSLWVLASCERFLEAGFCVTLLVITTTFTLTKCNNTKPQEQKVFSVMSTGKREGGLGRSANVYPVTSDKSGYLANGLFNGNLEQDNAAKSENYYSGWLDNKYAGTIDSTTSDFQLLTGKGTSTMSTVLYPKFGNIGSGDSGDDSAKDSYITNGQESSATSYSTLSSYRQVNPGHLCYCAPVASCCPSQAGGQQGFPNMTKQPVLLVSQYSHPQVPSGSAPQSEESSSGSSYYGSSLGSSHIYSSPQYYTCPTQVGGAEAAEIHMANQQLPTVHLHQCSEMINAGAQSRVMSRDDSRHIPSASLPILQDIPENSQRILQYRPQQPLPAQEMHCLTSVNGISHLAPRTPLAQSHHQHHHPLQHAHPHPLQQHHQHHPHPHHHIHPQHDAITPQQQQQQHPPPIPSTPVPTEMSSSSKQHHQQQQQKSNNSRAAGNGKNRNNCSYEDDHNRASSSTNHESPSVIAGCNPASRGAREPSSSFVRSTTSAEIARAPRESVNEPIISPQAGGAPQAIETIEGSSDCSFLNKLVRSPEGQNLSGSLELDTKRTSVRRKPFVEHTSGGPGPSSPPPGAVYRQHIALDDVDLPSQIV